MFTLLIINHFILFSNIRPLQTVTAAPVRSNGHTVAAGSGCNGRNMQELHADTDYLPGSPSSGHNDSGLPDKYFATSGAA